MRGLRSSRGVALLLSGCLLASLVLGVAFAHAGKTVETTWGGVGVVGGLFVNPGGVAVHEATGRIYIADSRNNRVQRLDADGNFELAWGRGVVSPGGSGDVPGAPNEMQRVTVTSGTGEFALAFRRDLSVHANAAEKTSAIAHDAAASTLQAALEGLPSVAPGDVSVTGPADGPWTVEFTGAFAGTDMPELAIAPVAGPITATIQTIATAGVFEICTIASECRSGGAGELGGALNSPTGVAVDQVTGRVYVYESGAARVSVFDADGNFERAFGWNVIQAESAANAPGNERQVLALKGATGGTFKIRWFSPSGGTDETVSIPHNATAAEVQAALEGLPTIAPGDVALSGPAGGPWTIEFTGAYADVNVRAVEPGASALRPEGFRDISVNGVRDGGSFEVCVAASECQAGAAGEPKSRDIINNNPEGRDQSGSSAAAAGAGQLIAGKAPIAVDPLTGSVYVGALLRVNQFASDGSFVRAFGWGVDTGSGQFEVCTAASACQHAVVPPSVVPGRDPYAANGQLTEEPRGLAIDGVGVVYVAASYAIPGEIDPGNRPDPFVFRFDSTKASAAQILRPNPISDSTVNERCTYCTPGPLPIESTSGGMDVDSDTGNLFYVANDVAFQASVSGGIAEIDPSTQPATLVDTHLEGAGRIGLEGIALHEALERLYVSVEFPGDEPDLEDRILVVGDNGAPAHIVAINPPTDVTAITATLNGEVTPNGPSGLQTRFRFEYSTDGINWTRVPIPDEAVGDGSGPVAVSKSISGLEANIEYSVRLVATKGLGFGAVMSPELKFTTDPLPPTVVTRFPRSRTDDSATLFATINPNNSPTSYHFEYGETTAYGSQVPIPDASLAGGGPKNVLARIEGLKPDTTYHYRVVASNGVEEESGDSVVEGLDVAFTTRSALGGPPDRAFEMVTPPFKVVRAPVSPGGVSGFNPNPAFPALSGDTIVWNVPYFPLSDDVGWPDEGDKRIIRRTPTGWVHETMNTLRLIDGAYAYLLSQETLGNSADMETYAWMTTGGIPNFQEGGGLLPTEGPIANRLYTRRFGTGVEGFTPWLTNPSLQVMGVGIPFKEWVTPVDAAAFNDDGSAMARWGEYAGLAEDPNTPGDDDPSDDQPIQGTMLYLQRAADPDLMPSAPKDLVNECTGTVAGGDATLVPERVSDETLGIDTLGMSQCEAGTLTQARGAMAGARSAEDGGGPAATSLADDGRRIFFASPESAKGPTSCTTATGPSANDGTGTNCPPQLFVRQYRADGSAVVRWISRSRSLAGPGNTYSGPPISSQPIEMMGSGASFEAASRDGRYVFFKTNAPLVPSDPNRGDDKAASNASWDLYRYELPASHEVDPDQGSLLRISGGPSGGADPNTNTATEVSHAPPGSGGALRFHSDDGSRAYFVTAAPIPGADSSAPDGGVTTPGGKASDLSARNLYLFDAEETGADRYRFVARLPLFLAHSDPTDPNVLNYCASLGRGVGGGGLLNPEAGEKISVGGSNCFRGTPDGKQVVFFTRGQLTGDDDDGAGDIYLYDAEADELTRITAPRPGAAPYVCNQLLSGPHGDCNGDFGWYTPGFHARIVHSDAGRGWGGFRYSNVYRNADGTLSVIFESRSSLVPEDENGDHWDVYEWREGKLSLISRGTPGHHSYYSGNGQDGRDVFVWTSDRIDPRELDDGSFDVYDARIGGGFPYTAPPEPCAVLALECEGDAIAPPPARGAATPSATSSGNVTSKPKTKPCRKGKVRRKGRCIRSRGKANKHRKGGKHKRRGGKHKGKASGGKKGGPR